MKEPINFLELHEKAAAGDKEAWRILHGWIFSYGDQINRDEKLRDEFERLRDHFIDEKGEIREPDLEEYAEALKAYTVLAEKGCSAASEILLKWYTMGIYVKQDYRKCFDLLTDLYEHRDFLEILGARRDLIFCYANGIGTEKDFEKAYRLVHEDERDPYYTILPLFRSFHPAFLYPYDRISEEFLTFCRTEKKDPGFEIGYALYRCKDDGERVRLLMKHQYDCVCGFLCQGELGNSYLDGLYGLEKNGSAAFICFWLASRFTLRWRGFEEVDKIRLRLAECYDKGIGTKINPNACAAILSEIVYGYRQSIDDFDSDFWDLQYDQNYSWCLGPLEENHYEKLLENDLFKKYEAEIEKRVNLEEEGLVDDELIDISNLPFDPKTYF